jgi:hypothetical protein
MKVNVTCSGCDITVEEVDGKCTVVATQDGEVVEEFTIDCESTEEEEEEIEEIDVDVDVDVDSDMGDEYVDEDDEVMESVKTFDNFFKPSKKRPSKRRSLKKK